MKSKSQSPLPQCAEAEITPDLADAHELQKILPEETVIDLANSQGAGVEATGAGAEEFRENSAPASPFETVPEDILSVLFVQWVTLASSPSPHPAVVASHVCRTWRAVALTTPSLWTNIHLPLRLDDIYVKCSRGPFKNPPLRHDHDARQLYYISQCSPRIDSLAKMLRAFITRSSGLPLHLSILARDPHREISFDRADIGDRWRALFQPLDDVVNSSSIRWKEIEFNARVFGRASTSVLHLLQLVTPSSSASMQRATLKVVTYEPRTSVHNDCWQASIPGGIVDWLQMPVTSLSARMAPSDIFRVNVARTTLSQLDLGSPSSRIAFLPGDAAKVLKLTPNLVICSLHFLIPWGYIPRPCGHIPLIHLESITLSGNTPNPSFAEALHLPSLRHLFANDMVGSPKTESTSALLVWARRYGGQLEEVSLAHSMLMKAALTATLAALTNVARLELVWHPRWEKMRFGSLPLEVAFVDWTVLGQLEPDAIEGCVCACPKLRALVCKFEDGSGVDAERAVVNFVRSRRIGGLEEVRAVNLENVDIMFRIPPVRDILEELEAEGVDTKGVLIGSA